MIGDRTQTQTFPYFTRPARRRGFVGWIVALNKRYQDRQAMRAMSDHQLDDIGLTRSETDAAANAPVWDAPIPFR